MRLYAIIAVTPDIAKGLPASAIARALAAAIGGHGGGNDEWAECGVTIQAEHPREAGDGDALRGERASR